MGFNSAFKGLNEAQNAAVGCLRSCSIYQDKEVATNIDVSLNCTDHLHVNRIPQFPN